MGQGLAWCLRCMDAGHSVKWFLAPQYRKTGQGLVPKVESWQPHMAWADLVFMTDNAFYVSEVQKFIDKGFPVFGPNLLGTQLELDRNKGQEILRKNGIKVIPFAEFESADKAKAFVRAFPKRYVSKPSGNASKDMSYCSKGPRDMFAMLDRWKILGKIKGPFILQRFVKGVEMGVGCVLTKNGWSQWIEENFEFKKFMNGDIGVNTGEQGTIMRFTRKSKLFDEVLKPLEHALHRIGYIGYVDVNCIIDRNGDPWPLEFTMRPGWPAFQIQLEAQKGDVATWMIDAIHGDDTADFYEDIAAGVVVTIPDYPYSKLTNKDVWGYPVWGITKENRSHVQLAEVYAGKVYENDGTQREGFLTSGDYVYIATGKGGSVTQASKNAYSVVSRIEIPNDPQWRTDIGDRLQNQLPVLQKFGYAEGIKFDS